MKIFKFQNDLLKTNLQTKFSVKCSASGPKVTTKSMFVINFNFEWITLAVKQNNFRNSKKTYLGYKRTKYPNIHFASHICIHLCSEMNIGETWSISSPSTWSKVSSTKKKQIVNIFGQKLIWREVCSTNSLPSMVFYWKSIIKYSKALSWVVTQCFVAMSSRWMSTQICVKLFTRSLRNIAPR